MLAGFWLADLIGQQILAAQGLTGSSPLSGVPVAIVLGLLLRNTLPLPASLTPGLKFATTTILRAGIVLVGIRLSVFDVAQARHRGLAGRARGDRHRLAVRDLVQSQARLAAAAGHLDRGGHQHLRRDRDRLDRAGDRGRREGSRLRGCQRRRVRTVRDAGVSVPRARASLDRRRRSACSSAPPCTTPRRWSAPR